MKTGRNLWLSIVFIGVLVIGAVAAFATGTKPVLGLDLEGGVSVILAAPQGTTRDVMEQALENIRRRVDAVGVSEAQLFVNGRFIDVELPGLARGTIQPRAKSQWCLVGSAKQSYGCFATEADATSALQAVSVNTLVSQVCLTGLGTSETAPCFATQSQADATIKAIAVQPESALSATPTPAASPSPSGSKGRYCLANTTLATAPCFDSKQGAQVALAKVGSQATEQFCLVGADGRTLANEEKKPACSAAKADVDAALAATNVTHETTQYCVISSQGTNLGCFLSTDLAQARLQDTGQERLLQIIGTTARLEERHVLATLRPGDSGYDLKLVTCQPPQDQTKSCSFEALQNKPVTFLGADHQTEYKLGPVEITGDAINKATAVFQTATTTHFQTGWQINFTLTGDGSAKFGEVTTRLVGQQLAIVVDQTVISAPTVQSAITTGSGVITGSFTEQRAKDLATQLNAGALPTNLTKQQVLTVSPTLGKESLHQGIIAGIAGLITLAIYLGFYYRLLGLVTWLGMSIWAILALALVSLLGRTIGYALSLAGVAGLIVSLGITADSYIVFYERLKDEVRHGKTPRSAIQPAFERSFRTILTADFVTFLAAGILYLVAVSSVRGFALTLGVATVLDVFVVYFFKRPTVFLIARSAKLQNLRGFGLASGVAAEPAPVAGGSE